jgi:hypothetical protein
MTGRPVIGLILALVIEASHWTRLRWDFDEDAFSRAWQFTTLAIAMAAVLIWLDGNRYTALPSLLSWMPPLLLAMQFIQSYGMRGSMPLNAFSFLARRRRERNARLGLMEETTVFNFGNVMFGTCMVAASVGNRADTWMFLPGVVLLTGWSLLGSRNSVARTLVPLLAVATFCGFGGKIGIEYFEEWLGRTSGVYRGRFDPNYSGTMIGTIGPVRQSPEIVWRLRPSPGTPPPLLLRTGSFNTFIGTNWQNQRVAATDFRDLDTRQIGEKAYWLLGRRNGDGTSDSEAAETSDADAVIPTLPSFSLRGTAAEETPLPIPGDSAGLGDFELDGVERNSFGTVRVFPKNPVIDGAVYWKGTTNPELPPIPKEDLRLPESETAALDAAIAAAGLQRDDDLLLTLARLRTWFHKEFRYTRDLRIRYGPDIDGKPGPTALTKFLTTIRTGHCEYFATSACLVLRRLGVPTRYAVGYAVMEPDSKSGGFVIRGTHGHAWSRVWNEQSGRWIDFDSTPPDWFATATPPFTTMQRFNDAIKRLREDFFVWRNRPGNRLAVSLVMLAVALALAAFVATRLWRSRRTVARRGALPAYHGPVVRTPLHEIESRARKLLGPRPPGQTFARWLEPLRPRLREQSALDDAIALHQRLRFDPAPPPPDAAKRLAELARNLAAQLKR